MLSKPQWTGARAAAVVPLLLLLTLLPAAGCGGEDDSGGSDGRSSGGNAAADSGESEGGPEASSQAGDQSLQTFGSDATGSDREAVVAAVNGFLDARATGDWVRACTHLAGEIQDQLGQLADQSSRLKDADCSEIIGALSAGIPAKVRRDAAVAQIRRVRIKDDAGVVFYRTVGGNKSYIPISLEGSGWKVAAIAGSTPP